MIKIRIHLEKSQEDLLKLGLRHLMIVEYLEKEKIYFLAVWTEQGRSAQRHRDNRLRVESRSPSLGSTLTAKITNACELLSLDKRFHVSG